jgi:hypothetical protein
LTVWRSLPLLPWGSQCRLEQAGKGARSNGRPAGVALIDQVKLRFGWSDHDVADALGVWPSVVSRYRRSGVSAQDMERLRALSRLSPSDVDPPRRLVPKRGASGLPASAKGWRISQATVPSLDLLEHLFVKLGLGAQGPVSRLQ